MTIDDKGNIYISDSDNETIQKFSSNGTFILRWGSEGNGDGQFEDVKDIVFYNGYIYAADSNNKRIQKFDKNGNFILKWGSYGTGKGQFIFPQRITVDSTGNVYVLDRKNNYNSEQRIQKFTSEGNFILQ